MKRGIRLGCNESPCKDCQKRFLGCHSVCKEYKDFVEENAENRKIRQIHMANQTEVIDSFRKISVETTWRKRI